MDRVVEKAFRIGGGNPGSLERFAGAEESEVDWSRLHLHPLEGVFLPAPAVCQDVPGAPVDAVGEATVAPPVVAPVQVGCQAGVEPPAGPIV